MIVGVYRVFSTVTTHCNSTTGVWNGPFVRVSRSQSHFELKFYSDPFSPLCNYNLICPYSKLFLYSCSQFREVPVSSDSVQPWLSVQRCSSQPEPTVHVRCGPGVAFVVPQSSEHLFKQVCSYDCNGARWGSKGFSTRSPWFLSRPHSPSLTHPWLLFCAPCKWPSWDGEPEGIFSFTFRAISCISFMSTGFISHVDTRSPSFSHCVR